MGVHKSTIGRILKKYHETGNCQPNLKGGDRRSLLTEDHKIFIKNLVDEDCTITLDQIVSKLIECFSVKVSRQTVSNCLENFHYTLKKITPVPIARNTLSCINSRKKYFIFISNFNNY